MHRPWRVPTTLITAALTAAAPLLFAVASPASADDAPAPAPAAAQAPASSTVRINEVESNGGTPGDWVELVNSGRRRSTCRAGSSRTTTTRMSSRSRRAPRWPPGAFLVLDVDPVFGLGSADSARLFLPDGTTLVDTYSWTSHATTTYGRCPNGTGAFVTTTSSTKGAANDCSGQGGSRQTRRGRAAPRCRPPTTRGPSAPI